MDRPARGELCTARAKSLVNSTPLMFSVLKAQGNPVSLDVMPGSNHISLSDEGWKVFLAAFPKAAAKD